MKKNTLLTGLLLTLTFIFPVSASAYFTTSQSAMYLNDNTVLFSITYSFGMKNASLQMPILAQQNSEFNAEPVYLGYEFLNGDQSLEIENVAALVLSNAEIKEGEYVVPKGEARQFKFVVLARLADTNLVGASDLSLKVTSLPFTIISDGVARPNHLNEGELRNYKTPTIEL